MQQDAKRGVRIWSSSSSADSRASAEGEGGGAAGAEVLLQAVVRSCAPAAHGGPQWSRDPCAAHGGAQLEPEGGCGPLECLCRSRFVVRTCDLMEDSR